MESIEFESAHSLNDAVLRLAAVVELRKFWLLPKNTVAGDVSRDHVRLRCCRARRREWNDLEFVGRFVQRPDGVFLTGVFSWSRPWEIKASLTILGAIGVMMLVLCIAGLIGSDPKEAVVPFLVFSGIVVILAFQITLRNLRRLSDREVLSATIHGALA